MPPPEALSFAEFEIVRRGAGRAVALAYRKSLRLNTVVPSQPTVVSA